MIQDKDLKPIYHEKNIFKKVLTREAPFRCDGLRGPPPDQLFEIFKIGNSPRYPFLVYFDLVCRGQQSKPGPAERMLYLLHKSAQTKSRIYDTQLLFTAATPSYPKYVSPLKLLSQKSSQFDTHYFNLPLGVVVDVQTSLSLFFC